MQEKQLGSKGRKMKLFPVDVGIGIGTQRDIERLGRWLKRYTYMRKP